MSQIIIGLLGRAGSGKTTAAKYLEEKYGAKRYAFAASLKNLAKIVFDFTDEQVFGTQAQKEAIDPRYGVSPREMMIRLGDGARLALWPGVWADVVFEQIENQSLARVSPKMHVIEDCRYPNECKEITANCGYVIKLICPDSDSIGFADAPSEKSVDEVPKKDIFSTITANKSLESVALKVAIDEVMKKILAPTVSEKMLQVLKDVDAATGIVSKQIEKELATRSVLDTVGKPK